MKISKDTITAQEAAKILKCSRPNIDRLQLKGLLQGVPTIYPRWYFSKKQVIELSEKISSKKVQL